MAQSKKQAAKLSEDEEEMRKHYQLMLSLGMVEMVHDLGLLGPKGKPPKKEKKDGEKNETP